MSKVKFSYYEGNIKFKESLGSVSLDYFINSVKNPKPKFEELFKQIKEATDAKDTKLKRKLKQCLYSFTPSVIIPYGKSRSYFYIKSFTGLMQIDFDGIDSFQKATELKVKIFDNEPEIVCAFLSPSRKGIKCLMKTEIPTNIEHYKAMHKAMVNEFEKYGYLDYSTKNAVLPMFLSYDENILYRSFEEVEKWSNTDYSKPEYVRLNDSPTQQNISFSNKSNSDKYNYEKTIRILKNKFSNIINNGHPQVVSASLILGSRSGAGYIDKNEAIAILMELIESNNYLQKNCKGYTHTAKWSFENGYKSPKYY
jgi:hypothetical protein